MFHKAEGTTRSKRSKVAGLSLLSCSADVAGPPLSLATGETGLGHLYPELQWRRAGPPLSLAAVETWLGHLCP